MNRITQSQVLAECQGGLFTESRLGGFPAEAANTAIGQAIDPPRDSVSVSIIRIRMKE